jgi:FixJ family two-component response regulator
MARTSANVALVEDDASVRKAIVRLLTVAGFQTTAFDSAEAFLDCSETAKQNGCVVIDINLPGLSGFDLQERLSSTATSLPVVFITAHDEPSVRARFHQSGAIAYLVKPFPAEELISAVRKALCPIIESQPNPGQSQADASPLVRGDKEKFESP